MVGALEAAHRALGLGTSRAPRWRQTLKKPCALALVVAHEQQALAGDVAGDEGAALGERLRVADADPAAEEEVLRLPGGDRLVDVGAGRELGGLEQRAARLRELGLGEGRRHAAGNVSRLRAFDYMVRIA